MTARPSGSTDMSFRAPLDADWPTILEIANESVADVAGAPRQDEWLRNRRAFGAHGRQDHFVLIEANRVVGYGAMERPLQDPSNGYRLFVVASREQLNDTGRKIYEQLEARLKAVGATDSWFIEYAQANSLIAFIRAQGYAELRQFALKSGETAIVLARKHSEAADAE